MRRSSVFFRVLTARILALFAAEHNDFWLVVAKSDAFLTTERNRAANIGIVAGAVLVFAGAMWLVRSQETVDDVAYMKAMIPHHSIAIMTSERAHIRDPEVRLLADRIIDAQVREIAEMKRLIARLEARSTPDGAADLPSYRDRQVPPPPPETDADAGVNTLAPIS